MEHHNVITHTHYSGLILTITSLGLKVISYFLPGNIVVLANYVTTITALISIYIMVSGRIKSNKKEREENKKNEN